MKPLYGNKAHHLSVMREAGFRVPPFAVFTGVPSEDELAAALDAAGISGALPSGEARRYAVRSSADVEDGEQSFAGQFTSYLNVGAGEITGRIRECLKKARDADLSGYMASPGGKRDIQMAVIVQEMICADCSGVLFTRDPAGICSQAYAEIEEGTAGITAGGASAVLEYRYSYPDEKGFSLIRGHGGRSGEGLEGIHAPSDAALKELAETGMRLEKLFGEPQDIEFAYRNGELFILQSRRITADSLLSSAPDGDSGKKTSGTSAKTGQSGKTGETTKAGQSGTTGETVKAGQSGTTGETAKTSQSRKIGETDKTGEGAVILDNSNIVESYPGITLPLTASFVGEVYSEIFTSLVRRLCGRLTQEELDMTHNMVASVDGRMYYQINNWYRLIEMLLGSRRLIPVWERSLGVSDSAAKTRIPVKPSAARRLRIAARAAGLIIATPKGMAALENTFRDAKAAFEQSFPGASSIEELFKIYDNIMSDVMSAWDITLVNDMYAFIMTALANRKNDRTSGIRDIASLKPLLAMYALADSFRKGGDTPSFRGEMRDYIETYGDRTIGELKLETVTYRQDEELLLDQVRALASSLDMERKLETLRQSAAGIDSDHSFFGSRARTAIGWREFSRMNRSRLYGFARSIFTRMGELLEQDGLLDDARDVFYLTTEELRNSSSGRTYKELVAERREAYSVYTLIPARRRIVFEGVTVNTPTAAARVRAATGRGGIAQMSGRTHVSGGGGMRMSGAAPENGLPQESGCAPENASTTKNMSASENASTPENVRLAGRVCSRGGKRVITGEPLVLDEEALCDIDPSAAAGKIIVARTTDPGWVFLLSQAQAIIAEKGSLLSHTAIVSRELGIPALLGVTGACDALRGAKEITIDMSEGFITIADSM